jgi:hypothetical protein
VRRHAELPYQSELLKKNEHVVREIDFPPQEAMPHGSGVAVVIVVPTLAERDGGEEPVVAASVVGLVRPRAEDVREAVVGEGRVVGKNGRPDEAHHHAGPTSDGVAEDERQDRGSVAEAVQEAELGIARKVAHLVELGRDGRVVEDPTGVRPPNPVLRRMEIIVLIGVPMVVTMMRGPPEHALLQRCLRAEREDELHHAARLERAVGEVTVVTDRHGQKLKRIDRGAQGKRSARNAGPHRRKGDEME